MNDALATVRGRRILVTGAARGIGRAVLEAALAQGARVVAVDLPAAELDAVGAGLPTGSAARGLDLRDVTAFPALCADAAAVMGGLDALVHVAGVIVRRDLEDVTEADWDLQHDVNLKATFFLCREVARTIRSHGSGGSLVTFASQGWWTGGFGGSVAYAASKGGVVSMTRGLARTLAADRIRVNAVAPGFIDTDMMREGVSDQARRDLVEQVPLGRLGDPAEVAAAALFLVSEASAYMTGTTLNLSGGQLAY